MTSHTFDPACSAELRDGRGREAQGRGRADNPPDPHGANRRRGELRPRRVLHVSRLAREINEPFHLGPGTCGLLSIGLSDVAAARLRTDRLQIRAVGATQVVLDLLSDEGELMDAVFASSVREAMNLAASCFPGRPLCWEPIER